MDRRTSLKTAGLLMGAAAFPTVAATFLQSCKQVRENDLSWTPLFFTQEQADLAALIADCIIPATDTPGAADAQVHIFIDLYVRDCYPPDQQKSFVAGLDQVQNRCQERYNKPFSAIGRAEQIDLLTALEKEDQEKEVPFTGMIKNLTVLGYFTSQEGAKKGAVYDMDPGVFQGCIDLEQGQKVSAFKYTF